MTNKIPRYRMTTCEKLDYGRKVNACFDEDVTRLEDLCEAKDVEIAALEKRLEDEQI